MASARNTGSVSSEALAATKHTHFKIHDIKCTTFLAHMSSNSGHGWTFLTNHTQVLLRIARDPNVRLRDVAEHIGITERAVQRIVSDLTEAGFLERTRVGRRNHYAIKRNRPMRHPAQLGHDIGALLDLLEVEEPARRE